jgi:hypothetical protein
MLMFFTLGSSMLGDVCDDAERRTGLRSDLRCSRRCVLQLVDACV